MASRGLKTTILDINPEAVETVNSGKLPFFEPGAAPLLKESLEQGLLAATLDPQCIEAADTVIVIIGTPVDEHLNPNPNALIAALDANRSHFRDGQLIVLRSTIFPGVTESISDYFLSISLKVDVAFCPERIAEHAAIEELVTLPQIVAGITKRATDRASEIFSRLTKEIVVLSPAEAELAKLFTNSWRYIKFAAANQFFMMANDLGLDYERIRHAIKYEYPRALDLPGAGFAAGPCLFKDTMQLSAVSSNNFFLGHSAMLVNEGLPAYVVDKLEEKYGSLKDKNIGILGMAFKGGSDDIRSSLSYKLKRQLDFKAKRVTITDPLVSLETEPRLLDLQEVLDSSDILIIGAPHKEYRSLNTNADIVDIWNLQNNGVSI